MISTYLGYQLYARDETRSQARVDAEPVNKIAKAYYDANIGKVTSVDDFREQLQIVQLCHEGLRPGRHDLPPRR